MTKQHKIALLKRFGTKEEELVIGRNATYTFQKRDGNTIYLKLNR
jgi:hypothetical protein